MKKLKCHECKFCSQTSPNTFCNKKNRKISISQDVNCKEFERMYCDFNCAICTNAKCIRK